MNIQAITATVFNAAESPCLSTRETVSVVPVDGDHVILKGLPTGMVAGRVAEVKENGFWASVRRGRARRERRVGRLIMMAVGWWMLDVVDVDVEMEYQEGEEPKPEFNQGKEKEKVVTVL